MARPAALLGATAAWMREKRSLSLMRAATWACVCVCARARVCAYAVCKHMCWCVSRKKIV
jgi:hypothetical protein